MKEIELSDKMLARRDAIDNAAYNLLKELVDVTDEEAEKIYPWDIADIELLQGFAISILNRKGHYICNPYIATKDGRQYRCTLSECFCKECKYQDEFMDKERILSCIQDAIDGEGVQVTDISEDGFVVTADGSGNTYKIHMEVCGGKDMEDGRK